MRILFLILGMFGVKLKKLASVLVLTVANSVLVVAQIDPPVPPLHRASTVMLSAPVEGLAVRGDSAFFGREADVISWDLKNSRELWKHQLDSGAHAKQIAVDGAALFISTDPKEEKGNSALLAGHWFAPGAARQSITPPT
jgi:hypothetical protein